MGASRSKSVDLPTFHGSESQENELSEGKQRRKHSLKEKPEPLFEKEVCLASEMQDNEMREIEINNHKLLLIKANGEFSTIGHLCTHYGSQLVNGVLSHGRVRCPRHGACFNIKTGDIEEFPCMDGLQSYKTEVQDGKVIVFTTTSALNTNKRTQNMVTRSLVNKNLILLIGGGPASLICAETLRQEGYTGRIIIATKEMHLPYDRPKLSKTLDINIEHILLRKPEFYSTNGIEVLINKEATSVNTKKRKVSFKDGTSQRYDNLLLATGSIPRMLSCLGADLENICLLRSFDDAIRINKLATAKDIVIVGSSFIGMEIAAYLVEKASSVSVVGNSEVPYQHILGTEVGKAIMKVKDVVLASGKVLPADLCVVGIGVRPATHYLHGSQIKTDPKGTVIVDEYMQTNVERIYAAGDITSFPLPLCSNENVNISHWQIAHKQGYIAALNMQNKKIAIDTVPFFWTFFFGKSLRYAGYGADFEEVIIQGNMDELKFVAFYIKEDKVVAVASLNYDPVVAQVAEVLASGKTISKLEAQDKQMPWLQYI
ncbi:apoptosis inducing factor mitochondria associated 4 isoform X2 [Chiloscyllium plagiosum]|uniref:apoptosis inducing factor mitochondria associated 4 isoform X2 n=1 Tax=Chiloscyllium plagiosum TaxID=36176 RepID=UPI001CB87E02|nr:apoptosis inducing factor mitochondria associated 4 isoform X2 [Chiloscyllium plagiosum]